MTTKLRTVIFVFGLLSLGVSDARVLKSKGANKNGKKGSSKGSNTTNPMTTCFCDVNGMNVSHSSCFQIPGSVVVCEPN